MANVSVYNASAWKSTALRDFVFYVAGLALVAYAFLSLLDVEWNPAFGYMLGLKELGVFAVGVILMYKAAQGYSGMADFAAGFNRFIGGSALALGALGILPWAISLSSVQYAQYQPFFPFIALSLPVAFGLPAYLLRKS